MKTEQKYRFRSKDEILNNYGDQDDFSSVEADILEVLIDIRDVLVRKSK